MENKTSNENTIVCRKCGGPHFTIKCGKEKKEEPVKTEQTNSQQVEEKPNKEQKHYSENKYKDNKDRNGFKKDGDGYNKDRGGYNKDGDGDNKEQRHRGDRKYFKVTYRVKLSELPIDMTEEEMMELTTDWGHIVRIKLLVYADSSTAYIDFGYEDEADYFVEAIDKTPLEYRVLTACRVESFRAEKTD